MTEYTPTTERMRDWYVRWDRSVLSRAEYEAEFDRWLRKVQAEAFNEGASAYGLSFWDGDAGVVENPYI